MPIGQANSPAVRVAGDAVIIRARFDLTTGGFRTQRMTDSDQQSRWLPWALLTDGVTVACSANELPSYI